MDIIYVLDDIEPQVSLNNYCDPLLKSIMSVSLFVGVVRRWLARMKCAGLVAFIIGVLVIIIGSAIRDDARRLLTPSSVSVSGYFRADGTYISPHSRRPAGSRSHDAAHERKMGFGLLLMLGGGLLVLRFGYRLLVMSDLDFVKELSPTKNIKSVPILNKLQFTTKREMHCFSCRTPIRPGTLVWHSHTRNHKSWREPFTVTCSNCNNKARLEYEQNTRHNEQERERYERFLREEQKRLFGKS